MSEKKGFSASFSLIVVAAIVAVWAFLFSSSETAGLEGFKTDPNTGFSFPLQDDFQMAGKKLELLGMGTRKKLVLNVYSVAFYGSKPVTKALAKTPDGQSKCSTIIESKGTKAATLIMNLGLNAEKMAEALTNIEGVQQNVKDKFGEMILTGIDGKLKKGESMTLEWKAPSSVAVTARGKMIGDIKDKSLYEGLLKAYLGPKSVSPALKESIEAATAEE